MSEDDKKRDRALQRRVRERQAKTGESYQAAWRQLTGSDAPTEEVTTDEAPTADAPPHEAEAAVEALQTKWRQLIGGGPVVDPPTKAIKTSFDAKNFASTERLILPLHLPRVLPQQPTRITAHAKKGAVDLDRIFISNTGTEGGAGDWIVN